MMCVWCKNMFVFFFDTSRKFDSVGNSAFISLIYFFNVFMCVFENVVCVFIVFEFVYSGVVIVDFMLSN